MSLVVLTGLTLAAARTTGAATITYLGADETTNAEWRTTSVAKPSAFDPNGDNAYGSDGYSVLATGHALATDLTSAPYISSVTRPAGQRFFSGTPLFDDPAQPIGTPSDVGTGLIYPNNGGASPLGVLRFSLAQSATFVITIPLGGSSAAHRPAGMSLRVDQTTGGSATTSASSVPALGGVDYVFFQVEGSAGDAFDIVIGGGNGAEAIAGVAFESAAPIPEPSAFALFGVGGLALLLRRRR